MEYIAFDVHKHYTWAVVENERGSLREFLKGCEPASPLAVETVENWYWVVDEIEAAGLKPKLAHAGKAKLMMGLMNKTDKLDARGLKRLQRVGTLPTVWIPPGELRDARDLPRKRMLLMWQRIQLKNSIHATLVKYALTVVEMSDLFGVQGRRALANQIPKLPPQTRYTTQALLAQLDSLERQIQALEKRMYEMFEPTAETQLLQTLPGVGFILAIVIELEVGRVDRFPGPEHLVSYAGQTPGVHEFGGKTRYGKTRPEVNQYLKWAYTEAANVVTIHRLRFPHRHASSLYDRVTRSRGNQKAVRAVGRHLAEATYWVLKKRKPYCKPAFKDQVSGVGA